MTAWQAGFVLFQGTARMRRRNPDKLPNPLKAYRKRNRRLRDLNLANTYYEYLDSPLWAEIRQRVLTRDNHLCLCCGKKATQVHHRNYRVTALTGDQIHSMFSICGRCHKWIELEKDGSKSHISAVGRKARILRHLNKMPDSPNFPKHNPPKYTKAERQARRLAKIARRNKRFQRVDREIHLKSTGSTVRVPKAQARKLERPIEIALAGSSAPPLGACR